MAQAPKLSADRASFVRDIVSDPKSVPDVMLLYGYLGASSEEGHERLYLSPDLTNYVEVPTAAILHQMAAPKEQDPHGGVTLWVKKDAALVYRMAPAAEALAHYFAGAIQAGMPGAAALPQPRMFTQGANCDITVACHHQQRSPGMACLQLTYAASCACQIETIYPCTNNILVCRTGAPEHAGGPGAAALPQPRMFTQVANCDFTVGCHPQRSAGMPCLQATYGCQQIPTIYPCTHNVLQCRTGAPEQCHVQLTVNPHACPSVIFYLC